MANKEEEIVIATDRKKMIDAISRYAWGFDTADCELLAQAFTEDATSSVKVKGADIAWGPMRGGATR